MPMLDPIRRFEPAEDVQLRGELRDLLGLGPQDLAPAAEPSPELVALAEGIRREAWRRSRTEHRRPTWGLLAAAALPLLAALTGLGVWGHQQKVRADALAVQAQRQEQELARLASSHATEVAREREAKEAFQQKLQVAARKAPPKGEPYLVIPIERPLRVAGEGYQQVKQ